jgi:flagellar hook-basal body complex protein FliE
MDGISLNKSIGSLDSKSISSPIHKSSESLADVSKSFSDTLKEAVQNVNQLQKDSDKKMQELAAGKTDNIVDVMTAAEKADIALRLMMQVRNKIVDAYQEIMKMQV